MKIVISGGGKVGEKLCVDLSREGHDVVLIDRNPRRLEEIIDMADITGVVGNGAILDAQLEAGTGGADIFVAVSPDDENNIIAGVVAKRVGAKYTVIRVRDPEYSMQLNFLRDSFGVDMMINPELAAADEIVTMIRFPSASDVDVFNKGRGMLVGVRIDEDSPLGGVVLKELRRTGVDALVGLIKKGKEFVIPYGDTKIDSGDYVYFTGKESELHTVYQKAGTYIKSIKSVLITGGGRLTEYLLPRLIDLGIKVKVIEVDEDRANYLAGEYEKAEIVLGDGTNQLFLKAQGMQNYDCVIAMTNIDEENILLSLFAHQSGIKKTITKVNRADLLDVLPLEGLESIIRPRHLIADAIVRLVRSMGEGTASGITNLYRPSDGQVETLQFLVGEDSKIINTTLAEMKIKKDVMISLIIRGEEVIYPRGGDIIMPGDYVSVITKLQGLSDIDGILCEE